LALRLYTKLTARIVAETIQRKYKQFSWYLLYDLTENEEFRFQEFQPILPPKDRFWADPHILRVDDRYYIFIEEYLYKAGKGHISVIELEGKGRAKEPVRVLERDYHLSYPHVFEWQGRWYMVPESAEKRCIDLYECVEFPYRWTHKQRLMDDVIAFDSTLLHYEGKWWLFTALSEHEGAVPQVEFFLFYSQDIFTDRWHPHPQNPIISEAKCARPAGKVFIKNGEIFRPSQDCSEIYGSGFDLNQIVRLSESEYKEQKVVSVKPTWDDKILGTHTYAREGRLTVIDALTRRSKLV